MNKFKYEYFIYIKFKCQKVQTCKNRNIDINMVCIRFTLKIDVFE